MQGRIQKIQEEGAMPWSENYISMLEPEIKCIESSYFIPDDSRTFALTLFVNTCNCKTFKFSFPLWIINPNNYFSLVLETLITVRYVPASFPGPLLRLEGGQGKGPGNEVAVRIRASHAYRWSNSLLIISLAQLTHAMEKLD